MFEKEAKEYADKVYGNRTEMDHYGIADAFQEGAEFGYNKANEELGERLDKAKEMLEQFIKFSMFPLATEKDIKDVQILLKSASQFCKEIE